MFSKGLRLFCKRRPGLVQVRVLCVLKALQGMLFYSCRFGRLTLSIASGQPLESTSAT